MDSHTWLSCHHKFISVGGTHGVMVIIVGN